MIKNGLLFIMGVLTIYATSSTADKTNPNSSTMEISPAAVVWQSWVDDYDASRRSVDGWLSLVGLYWLVEGENTLGSAIQNRHRFPEGTPDRFGIISVTDGQVNFVRLSEEVRIDDKDIERAILLPNETVVSLGSYSFYIIERERGFAVRMKDTESPNIASFDGTHFYPYSESWVVPAKLVRHTTPQKINIATVYATVRESDSAGWLEFVHRGKKLRLQAVSYGPDSPMMLMFADKTGRSTTYGAGRFLDVKWPEDGDETFLDFNRAYNPPCAITAFATCPLPPPQNRLGIAVEAGELFQGH